MKVIIHQFLNFAYFLHFKVCFSYNNIMYFSDILTKYSVLWSTKLTKILQTKIKLTGLTTPITVKERPQLKFRKDPGRSLKCLPVEKMCLVKWQSDVPLIVVFINADFFPF